MKIVFTDNIASISAEHWDDLAGDDNPFIHISTFGGSDLGSTCWTRDGFVRVIRCRDNLQT